jgi:hypothetical protein
MAHRIAADLVLVVHLAFIVFVVLGGLLALRWRRAPWLHLPAATWGALAALRGWICPLTPLEIRLRHAAGQEGYEGGFVEHYIFPLVYPEALTREIQVGLGLSVLAVNAAIYALVCHLRRRGAAGSRRPRAGSGP